MTFGRAVLIAVVSMQIAPVALADPSGPEESLPSEILVSDRRFGPFYYKPFLEITDLGFNSNIYNTSDAKSDFTARVAPGIRLALPIGDSVLSIRQQVGYWFFRDAEASRNWIMSTRLGVDFLLGPLRVDLSEEFQRTNASYGVERVSRSLRLENAFVAAAHSDRDAGGYLEAGFRHAVVRFDEGEVLDEQSVADTFDRTVLNGSAALYLDLFDPARLAIGGQVERNDFRLQSDRDANSYYGFGGLRFEPGRRFSGDVRLGYRDLDLASGSVGDEFRGFAGDLSLTMELGGTSTMTVTGKRANSYSELSANYYAVGTWAGLILAIPLGERFSIGFHADWADLSYPLTADDSTLSGTYTYAAQGADFTFPIADQVFFSIGVEYRKLDGDVFQYDGTALTTGLRYAL